MSSYIDALGAATSDADAATEDTGCGQGHCDAAAARAREKLINNYLFTSKMFEGPGAHLQGDFEKTPSFMHGQLSATAVQMAVGPGNTGASFHHHESALNSLIAGRKLWLMYASARAVASFVACVRLQQGVVTDPTHVSAAVLCAVVNAPATKLTQARKLNWLHPPLLCVWPFLSVVTRRQKRWFRSCKRWTSWTSTWRGR